MLSEYGILLQLTHLDIFDVRLRRLAAQWKQTDVSLVGLDSLGTDTAEIQFRWVWYANVIATTIKEDGLTLYMLYVLDGVWTFICILWYFWQRSDTDYWCKSRTNMCLCNVHIHYHICWQGVKMTARFKLMFTISFVYCNLCPVLLNYRCMHK